MAIYINTNQNVQLKHEISSVGDRILAYIIDALIIGGLSFFFFFIGMQSGSWLGFSLILGVIFFYHFICEATMNGQSFGKKNRGIRVIKKDGRAATLSSYFLRFLLRPIDSIYGLGLAVIFFTEKGQRLGDLAAGTILVNVKDENDLKSDIKDEMYINTKEEIIYEGVSFLSDQDIQIIRNVLTNRKEEKKHKNIQLLAQKIASKLQIDSYEWEDYYFLKRVVQDYYSFHSE